MLTDRQMEYISDVLVPLFQYLESEVIADVAQRVKATMAFTRTAELEAQALHELGYSPAYIRKEVMKKLNADPEYRKLVAKNTLVHKRTVKKLLLPGCCLPCTPFPAIRHGWHVPARYCVPPSAMKHTPCPFPFP